MKVFVYYCVFIMLQTSVSRTETMTQISTGTYPGNSSVGFLIGLCFKRRFPYKEFIAQNSQAPNIHLLIMCSSLNHFGRQVVKCPTESCSPEEKSKLIID